MILHAKFAPDFIRDIAAYFLQNKYDAQVADWSLELEVDTTTNFVHNCDDEKTCPYGISSILEFNRFVDLIEGKTVARFNEGKVDFTLIDFELFDEYLCRDYAGEMNDISQDADDLLSDIRIYTNKIVFHREDRREYLAKLQLAAYQATAVILNIPLDSLSINLDLRVFEPMAQVLMFGAKKYERDNWRKDQPYPLSSAASLYRHLRDMRNGETLDKESGIHHLGHVMCNVMFLTYNLNYDRT